MLLAEEQIDAGMVAMLIPIVAITGGFVCAVVSIIMGTIRRTTETKAREESRRELAAYVAEGTMSPDDAAKILSAGKKGKDCGWPKA
jgi:hypothetical protein